MSTKRKQAEPKAKAKAKPKASAVHVHAKALTADGKHIVTVATISDARRALHEPNSTVRKALLNGVVTIDKLYSLMAGYGISESAVDRQLDFETRLRKTPVLKISGSGDKRKIELIDANRGFGFRRNRKNA